jgi:DNA-binding SARP family transcriptional activator
MSTVSAHQRDLSVLPDRAPADSIAVGLRLVTMGDFTVSRSGEKVALGQHQARALLAIMVCVQGPVHREKLIEWLWPHLPAERALSTLYSTVYTLRRRLGSERPKAAASSFVQSDGEAYRLDWGQDAWLDLSEFLHLARVASRPAPADVRIERLMAADAAYAGQFLPQWPYAEWAMPLRAEVEETYLGVGSGLAEALVEVGQVSAAVTQYRRLLAIDPEREAWHRALMKLFIRSGERAKAVQQFEACRRVLFGCAGMTPSPETEEIYASLFKSAVGRG